MLIQAFRKKRTTLYEELCNHKIATMYEVAFA